MARTLIDRINDWRTEFNSSFGQDISSPRARRLARLHTHLVDHAFLRKVWTNMVPVGAHAWRSNQPDEARLERLKARGIRSIINLRGPSAFAVYLFEREACSRLDLPLYDLKTSAYQLSDRETYLSLLGLFDRAERPVLMHCKSGADRTGIAAALWLIHIEGRSVAEVRPQLALKYLHRKRSAAGVLDFLLDAYERDGEARGLPLRTWFASHFDRPALAAEYAARAKPKVVAQ